MVNTYQKAAALLLALALIFALPVPASAAETTEARVPVTLTVVNTVSPIHVRFRLVCPCRWWTVM